MAVRVNAWIVGGTLALAALAPASAQEQTGAGTAPATVASSQTMPPSPRTERRVDLTQGQIRFNGRFQGWQGRLPATSSPAKPATQPEPVPGGVSTPQYHPNGYPLYQYVSPYWGGYGAPYYGYYSRPGTVLYGGYGFQPLPGPVGHPPVYSIYQPSYAVVLPPGSVIVPRW